MTRADFLAHLRRLGACPEARRWERKGKLSPADTWATCRRGDWLLWLAAAAGVRRQDVVLAACACARLALPRVHAGEDRPRIAIETAERWARGEDASLDDVRSAAHAAHAAYAANAAAPYAPYAAHAAYAAAHAAAAAVAAADVAPYAAYAAYAVDAAVARNRALAECADLVRERISWEQVEDALVAAGREVA